MKICMDTTNTNIIQSRTRFQELCPILNRTQILS
jgi:hypothetical protein